MNIPCKASMLICGAALATLAGARAPAVDDPTDLDEAAIERAFRHGGPSPEQPVHEAADDVALGARRDSAPDAGSSGAVAAPAAQ